MSQNTTKFAICYYFKPTTYSGPCCGPTSCYKRTYSRKLYSVSHKIYQYKIQPYLFVQYSNAVHDLVKIWIYHKTEQYDSHYLQ